MIPERTKSAIDFHVKEGRPCGDFVMAVLSNNLRESVLLADDENLELLPEILLYCYHEIPALCWGTKEKVEQWRANPYFGQLKTANF